MFKFICFLNGVCAVLICLTVSVFLSAFSRGFYEREFDKLNISEETGLQRAELNAVALDLIDYMKGKNDALTVKVHINGEYLPFFNEREILHMEDVRTLFIYAYSGVALCLVFFSCLIAWALIKKNANVAYYTANSMICILIACVLLTVFIAFNFERSFIYFHKIFFNNDLWILDPDTDMLINIVPIGFFIDACKRIALHFVFLNIICISLLKIFPRMYKT